MVSSSCITTILILNYHHRYHQYHHIIIIIIIIDSDQTGGHTRDAGVGAGRVPPVDALAPPHVQVRANTVLANTDSPDQQIYPIKVSDIQTSSLSRQSALSGALILFQHLYLFQAWRENHSEDNHDGQQDEGAGHEGDLLQVSALQRP